MIESVSEHMKSHSIQREDFLILRAAKINSHIIDIQPSRGTPSKMDLPRGGRKLGRVWPEIKDEISVHTE
jgi:hypothetical protein